MARAIGSNTYFDKVYKKELGWTSLKIYDQKLFNNSGYAYGLVRNKLPTRDDLSHFTIISTSVAFRFFFTCSSQNTASSILRKVAVCFA